MVASETRRKRHKLFVVATQSHRYHLVAAKGGDVAGYFRRLGALSG